MKCIRIPVRVLWSTEKPLAFKGWTLKIFPSPRWLNHHIQSWIKDERLKWDAWTSAYTFPIGRTKFTRRIKVLALLSLEIWYALFSATRYSLKRRNYTLSNRRTLSLPLTKKIANEGYDKARGARQIVCLIVYPAWRDSRSPKESYRHSTSEDMPIWNEHVI